MHKLQQITQEEFEDIYEKHQLWLSDNEQGKKADFSYKDLSRIDLGYIERKKRMPSSPQLMPIVLNHAILDHAHLRGLSGKSIHLKGASLISTNLIEISFQRSNFESANLTYTDLGGAMLPNARFTNARLINSNFTFANLTKAKFDKAIIKGAVFNNADLSKSAIDEAVWIDARLDGVIFSESSIPQSKKLWFMQRGAKIVTDIEDSFYSFDSNNSLEFMERSHLYETQKLVKKLETDKKTAEEKLKEQSIELEELEQKLRHHSSVNQIEKVSLKETIDNLKNDIEKAKIEALQKDKQIEAEKKAAEKKIKEIEQRGKDIEDGLGEAFNGLSSADDEIKPEIDKLNGLFLGFTFLAILLFLTLAGIWAIAFHDLHGQEIQISKIWIYTAPSLIIVGFIWASILQINRAQRLLISIRNDNKKYKIIKLALEGYYRVENKLSKTPIKAQETFSAIMDFEMEKKYDASTEEEKLRRECKKDQIPAKELLDQVIDYVEKLK